MTLAKAFHLPACFSILLSGCAGPGAYRYADRVLIPPGVKKADIPSRTVTLPVALMCPVATDSSDAVSLEPRKRSVRVSVKIPALRAQPAGWLARWSESLQQRGCLPPGQGATLAAQIAEIVPLEPRVAFSLLHPPEITYVDLEPGSRVYAVGPLFREGAKPGTPAIGSSTIDGLTITVKASPDLVGVETAWYAVEPNRDGPGGRIVFLSADDRKSDRKGDQITHPARPNPDYLHFAPDAAYYRLFTITRRSSSDHDMLVLAAPTKSELDLSTKRVEADPSECLALAASRACIEVPPDSVLARVPVVSVNGVAVAVQGRGAVRDALLAAGVKDPAAAIPTLRIQRRYLGRLTAVEFDRADPGILDLPLSGGEVLHW